jgi:flagellar basal-body rod protein FlgC
VRALLSLGVPATSSSLFHAVEHPELVRVLLAAGAPIDALVDDPSPVRRMSDPGNPLADKDGFVYLSNVNEMTEMVEMMAASRSYANNVEVINTTRQLLMRTIDITRS